MSRATRRLIARGRRRLAELEAKSEARRRRGPVFQKALDGDAHKGAKDGSAR